MTTFVSLLLELDRHLRIDFDTHDRYLRCKDMMSDGKPKLKFLQHILLNNIFWAK
jgi:hypothetical protein